MIFFVMLLHAQAADDFRGCQFIGWRDFTNFTSTPGDRPNEKILTSPLITTRIAWSELVASWNAELPTDIWLKVEARGLYDERATKFYALGLWSDDPQRHPRASIKDQKDADGDVLTDTLVLKRLCQQFQFRITLGSGSGDKPPALKFLGVSLLEARAERAELPPNRAAWGKVIDVPWLSQLVYPGGEEWCSPTSTSMVLAHWAERLKRPEFQHDVPEVVKAVFDPNWPGTGNWPFNTAFAGAHPGIRAYVARLSDVSELEDWIAAGLPVVVSVDYTALKGEPGRPSGHLVVCVGFTEQGDVIVNDPGTRHEIRRTFPRKNLIAAWDHSHRTVYLIYPESARVPLDRFGHWFSEEARARGGEGNSRAGQ